MIYKRIASICFALAFIAAIGVFTDYFSDFITRSQAKYGILIFGGIAFLMNLLSFRLDETANSSFNLLFWIGAVILFVGLIAKMQAADYSFYIILLGILTIGLSYVYNPFAKKEEDSNDLLDR